MTLPLEFTGEEHLEDVMSTLSIPLITHPKPAPAGAEINHQETT
jgi:hypothetical protein